jgi:hypothetical protein
MGNGPPKMWECNDCGACWSESKAKKCFNCLSDNIFIYWYPGKPIKPERMKIKSKPERIKLRSK